MGALKDAGRAETCLPNPAQAAVFPSCQSETAALCVESYSKRTWPLLSEPSPGLWARDISFLTSQTQAILLSAAPPYPPGSALNSPILSSPNNVLLHLILWQCKSVARRWEGASKLPRVNGWYPIPWERKPYRSLQVEWLSNGSIPWPQDLCNPYVWSDT